MKDRKLTKNDIKILTAMAISIILISLFTMLMQSCSKQITIKRTHTDSISIVK